ncbi:hypothetical protein LCER1_G008679 [Lachnellula cervina]|uniref:Uncharacterized protein n=1 Tax=Lachnellula cervina TaxID=1316786 RepID=A0A7D8YS89_9HELO|nr:hypothetical protein LCER1_G008679 [Lachnellula cervina]
MSVLANQSAEHAFTRTDMFFTTKVLQAFLADILLDEAPSETPKSTSESPLKSRSVSPESPEILHALQLETERSDAFTFEDRYASVFQGIMPDSGAAGISTAGANQVAAIQKLFPNLEIDDHSAGKHTIRFGVGKGATLKGSITVPTPVGPILFHIVDTNTPFLWCIQDMDNMQVRLEGSNRQEIWASMDAPRSIGSDASILPFDRTRIASNPSPFWTPFYSAFPGDTQESWLQRQ